jgi:hypothetical protein
MNIYTVIFYSADWGQIYWKNGSDTEIIPSHISKFVLKKADEQIGVAFDNKHMGLRFFFIKEQYCSKWTYSVGNDIVCIIYEFNYFNPEYMRIYGSSNLYLSK